MEGPDPWRGQAPGLGEAASRVDTTTGEILAHFPTPSARHDGQELPDLLGAVEGPVAAVNGDEANDGFATHAAILARGARPVIPPRKGAAITPPCDLADPALIRAEAVRRIIEIGRKAWKRETRYQRRSLAETAVGRYIYQATPPFTS